MARLALVAILVAVVFVGASAEWWTVRLQYTAGTNCASSGIVSAVVIKNDTCVSNTYSRYLCSPETNTYRAYSNCDLDVFTGASKNFPGIISSKAGPIISCQVNRREPPGRSRVSRFACSRRIFFGHLYRAFPTKSSSARHNVQMRRGRFRG